MIYYPLSALMLAGIQDILIISTPEDLHLYRRLLGSGADWGLSFFYAEQDEPRGLAEAFIIGKDFIDNQPACLILGDNIFYGYGLPEKVRNCSRLVEGARIFAYPVNDPERYGVVEFDSRGKVINLEEKPKQPRSRYAVPGIYFYDRHVSEMAASLKPSARGELEITDLNRLYLEKDQLTVEVLSRGFAWLDAGTHESLLQASTFIQTVQERQGMMISSPEEIAFRMGYINAAQLETLAARMGGTQYGQYLRRFAMEKS
jgi:glucose-1-phosphate thymidylyltransferase